MKRLFILLFIFVSLMARSQEFSPVIAQFNVNAGVYERHDTPMKIDVTDMNIEHPTRVVLYESIKGKKKEIPCQMDIGTDRRWLCFILCGVTPPQASRLFQLEYIRRKALPALVDIKHQGDAMNLSVGDREALTFQRSYIHPAKTPSQKIVTQLCQDGQPVSGFSHRLTSVTHAGEVYNIEMPTKMIEYNFDHFLGISQGQVFSSILVKNNYHIGNMERPTIIPEVQSLKLWNNCEDSTAFIWDLTSTILPVNQSTDSISNIQTRFFYSVSNKLNVHDCRWMISDGKLNAAAGALVYNWACLQSVEGKDSVSVLILRRNKAETESSFLIENRKGENEGLTVACGSSKGGEENDEYRVVMADGMLSFSAAQRYWTDFIYPPTVNARQLNRNFHFPKQYENKGSFLIIDYFHEHFEDTPTLKSNK